MIGNHNRDNCNSYHESISKISLLKGCRAKKSDIENYFKNI